jgi:excisionase family DNA binding protein
MTERSSAVAASAPRRTYKRLEVAERTGLSVRTIDRYIRQGELGVIRLRRTVLIEHDELERFIEAHAQ